jgi:hypothetical protein
MLAVLVSLLLVVDAADVPKGCVLFLDGSGDLCAFKEVAAHSRPFCEDACEAETSFVCDGIQMKTSQTNDTAFVCEILTDAATNDCDLVRLKERMTEDDVADAGEWTIVSRECFDSNYTYIPPNRTGESFSHFENRKVVESAEIFGAVCVIIFLVMLLSKALITDSKQGNARGGPVAGRSNRSRELAEARPHRPQAATLSAQDSTTQVSAI